MKKHNSLLKISVFEIILASVLVLAAAPAAQSAGWDTTSGIGAPGVNGTINAMAFCNGYLYVGGTFTSPGSNIARWKTSTSAWEALGGGINGTVLSIACDSSGNVYAGGSFTSPGNCIAKWKEGSGWSPMGSGLGAISVTSLAIDTSGNVYAGITTNYNGHNVYKWSSNTWTGIGSAGSGASVNALTFYGGNLYAGGDFNHVAIWNSWTPVVITGASVNAIAFDSNGNLYVGGTFTNKITGTSVGDDVHDLAADSGGRIYAGGKFTTPTSYVGIYDGTSWSAMGLGVNGQVNAVVFNGGRVFVGGSFSTANGSIIANNIALYWYDVPPTAVPDPSYTATEDIELPIGVSVLANDTDNDTANGNLTAKVITNPAHGTLTAFNTNGTFSYKPADNYNGTDTFTYQACDSASCSNAATVTINIGTVPDAPVITEGSSVTVQMDENSTPTPFSLTLNATDADGDALTWSISSNGTIGTATATADTGTSKAIGYTPDSYKYGADSFVVQVSDGSLTDSITVNVNIRHQNHAPVAVNDGSYSTNEDTPLTFTGNILSNDTDVDLGETLLLTAVKFSDPAHGTVTFNPNGTFVYTPAPNYYGADSFTYRAFDGLAYSSPATVSINVTSVNDPPIANNETYNADQNTALTVPAPGVLANDRDIEGDALTAVKFSDPAHGTVTLNPDGSFMYQPAAGYAGPDSFTYQARDSQGANDLSNIATVMILTSVPIPEMVSVSSVRANSVVATGSGSGNYITERGFYWWNKADSSGLIPMSGGTGTYSMTIGNLKPQNTYNIRSYIKVGGVLISSENILTFTTVAPTIPTVHTDSQFTITGADITPGGEITDIGTMPVLIYGFVYANHSYPTVWDKALAFSWDTQCPLDSGKKFSSPIKNLPSGTYYLRSYAHNDAGTAYGEEITFTITAPPPIMAGDVNGNGAIDLEDAIIVLRILSGINVTEPIKLEADVNRDGRIGIEELLYILQHVSELRATVKST